MTEDQRREYDSLLKGIVDQVEAMEDPQEEEEMLFDKVRSLSEKVEELQSLLESIY